MSENELKASILHLNRRIVRLERTLDAVVFLRYWALACGF